jgi:hypothetical protein
MWQNIFPGDWINNNYSHDRITFPFFFNSFSTTQRNSMTVRWGGVSFYS